MPKDTDSYGGDYLRAEDLLYEGKFHTVTVTIEKVIPAGTIKTAENKMIPHPTLQFVGKRKMLVLCAKTNQRMVRHWSGQDLEDSAGTTIILQPRVVPFGNGKNPEMVLAIRVMPPKGAVLPKNLKKMLGAEAIWTPPTETAKQEKPKKESEKEKPVEPAPSEFEKLLARINAKTPQEATDQYATVMSYIAQQNESGAITDEEFSKLGEALTAKVSELEPADQPEEPTEAEATE